MTRESIITNMVNSYPNSTVTQDELARIEVWADAIMQRDSASKLREAAPDLLDALKDAYRVLLVAPIIGKDDLVAKIERAIDKATA